MTLCICCGMSLAQSSQEDDSQAEFQKLSSDKLVCLLQGPELTQRLGELKTEIFQHLQSMEEVEKGYIFHFPDDKEFILKLMDYVLAERSCCPFFQFDLSFAPQNSGVALQVSGPPEAKEMLRESLEGMK